MVTFSSTKRNLACVIENINSIEKLIKLKVELLDAYAMAVLHEDYCLTKQALERGFLTVVECDQTTGFTLKDKFMGVNINSALERIIKKIEGIANAYQMEI